MSVQNLLEAMTDLHEQYSELLGISEQKRTAIITKNYDELLKTLNAESRKTKVIREAEEKLTEAAQQLLREKGIQSRLQLQISEILRLVFDSEEKERLKEKHTALKATLEALRTHNDFNQKLIEQSLLFIDYSMNLMTGSFEQEPTYSPPALQDKKPKARSMFDTRA